MTDKEERTLTFPEEMEHVKAQVEKYVPPKPYWFWLKNSNGDASASLTFVTVAFVITTLTLIASSIQTIGPITFRPFDVGAAGVYLMPLLMLYFGRRFTEAKFKE